MSFRCHWMHPGFCRYIVLFCLLATSGFPVSYFHRFYHTPAASQSSWSDKSFFKLKMMCTFTGSVFCCIFTLVSCDTKIPLGPVTDWLKISLLGKHQIQMETIFCKQNKKGSWERDSRFFFFLCKCTNLRTHAECKETNADRHTLISQWHTCVLINHYCLHLFSWFLALSTNVCVCSLF